MSFRDIEWEFPELAELPTCSASWYRQWRTLHLAKYPDVDQSTRDNLDMFVDMAETREGEHGY